MSIFLGTILYLQCILKDLFFGVDLGGIEVTQCFFIISNPLAYLGGGKREKRQN